MFYVITFLQEWQTHQLINRGLVSFGDYTCKILHFPQRLSDQQIRSGGHGGMTRLRKEKQRKERKEMKKNSKRVSGIQVLYGGTILDQRHKQAGEKPARERVEAFLCNLLLKLVLLKFN